MQNDASDAFGIVEFEGKAAVSSSSKDSVLILHPAEIYISNPNKPKCYFTARPLYSAASQFDSALHTSFLILCLIIVMLSLDINFCVLCFEILHIMSTKSQWKNYFSNNTKISQSDNVMKKTMVESQVLLFMKAALALCKVLKVLIKPDHNFSPPAVSVGSTSTEHLAQLYI